MGFTSHGIQHHSECNGDHRSYRILLRIGSTPSRSRSLFEASLSAAYQRLQPDRLEPGRSQLLFVLLPNPQRRSGLSGSLCPLISSSSLRIVLAFRLEINGVDRWGIGIWNLGSGYSGRESSSFAWFFAQERDRNCLLGGLVRISVFTL